MYLKRKIKAQQTIQNHLTNSENTLKTIALEELLTSYETEKWLSGLLCVKGTIFVYLEPVEKILHIAPVWQSILGLWILGLQFF